MAVCGVWRAGRRLVAAVVDEDGHIMREPATLAAATDDERWALLGQVDATHGLDCELVFPDDMVKTDRICRFALDRRHISWGAPLSLIVAIRNAAGLSTPVRVAAMIARLAIVPGFRAHLRRIDRCIDLRQLPLL
jgi:hypothetical protein